MRVAAILLALSVPAVSPAAEPVRVAVLGGPAAAEFLTRTSVALGKRVVSRGEHVSLLLENGQTQVSFTAIRNGDAIANARALSRSRIAIIVVDATEGPTLRFREDVLIARQSSIPVVLGFARCAEVMSPELSDLLPLEIEESMGAIELYYGARGPWALCDAPAPGTKTLAGPLAMRPVEPRPPPSPGAPRARLSASVYVLAKGEGAMSRTLKSGEVVQVVVGGAGYQAQLVTPLPIRPAENADVELVASGPAIPPGRFFLLERGHVLAVGVSWASVPHTHQTLE